MLSKNSALLKSSGFFFIKETLLANSLFSKSLLDFSTASLTMLSLASISTILSILEIDAGDMFPSIELPPGTKAELFKLDNSLFLITSLTITSLTSSNHLWFSVTALKAVKPSNLSKSL